MIYPINQNMRYISDEDDGWIEYLILLNKLKYHLKNQVLTSRG